MVMRPAVWLSGSLLLIVFAVAPGVGLARAQGVPKPYDEVLKYLGRSGDFQDHVLKVNIPRNDLKISVDGASLPTPFGFGGWLGFTKGAGGNDVMMGDLVLLQQEVNPVMSALLDNGLEVTALHNHFFYDEPRLFYMHVHGFGTPADLAREVKPALDLIGHLVPSGSEGAASTRASNVTAGTLNADNIAKIVGHKGDHFGSVYKITIGRSDLHLKEMGGTINSRMGMNTWAAFYGSDDHAVVAGDIAMLEGEVTPVLKALRKNGLEVVAIHQHMTGTKPMIIFLHYWGSGAATTLATGFREAIEKLGKSSGMHMK